MSRTLTLPPIRVSAAEKALIRERAQACGLGISEYLRRLGLTGTVASVDPRAVEQAQSQRKAERQAPGDFEAMLQRIRWENPTMPEPSRRILARRELQRG